MRRGGKGKEAAYWLVDRIEFTRIHSVDGIFCRDYTFVMSWNIEYTDEFGDWWGSLSEEEQESLDASVRLLEERGPVHTVVELTDRGMDACGSSVSSMTASRCAPFTRLIRDVQRSC